MKLTPLARAMLFASALLATLATAHAQVSDGAGYTTSTFLTDPNGNNITGFDWDSSNNLYYQAQDSSTYGFDGLYKYTGTGMPTAVVTSTATGTFTYAGASVVSIGSHVYYNDSNGNISVYDPASATGSGNPVVSSPALLNYGLFGNGGQLYLTGAGSSTANAISFSSLNPTTGAIVTNPSQVLEADTGASGPLAFDSVGNLYYAPGYGSTQIYEWSASQVLTAKTDDTPLPSAQLLLDYSLTPYSQYASYLGGTSLVLDGDQLLITLTSFTGASALVDFGLTISGTNVIASGTSSTLLTNSGGDGTFLNQLQLNNGNLYVSNGDQILEVAPEPSTIFLLALGLVGVAGFHLRRTRRLASAAALIASSFFFR